jgi:DNA-binding MarR family transcriptional regulator
MGPLNNTTYLIEHIGEVLSKQIDQLLEEQLGIRLSQYKILMALEWNPLIEQKVIASSLGQTEASISRQIKLLIKKGLLKIKTDSANKKRRIAVPTPIGMQVTEAANGLIKQNLGENFTNLDESEVNKLNKALQVIHANICKQGKTGSCNHLLA